MNDLGGANQEFHRVFSLIGFKSTSNHIAKSHPLLEWPYDMFVNLSIDFVI